MQFLTMIKMREDAGAPTEALQQAMGEYIGKMSNSGKVVSMGGLMPSSAGFTVRSGDGKALITDGPFTEGAELIGGWAILEVDSREEIEELTKEFVQLHIDNWPGWEGTSEVRQIAEF